MTSFTLPENVEIPFEIPAKKRWAALRNSEVTKDEINITKTKSTSKEMHGIDGNLDASAKV